MSNTTKRSADYKVQVILDGDKNWPYLGNGYTNKNGSVTLILDSRWKLVHQDGTTLQATTAEDGKRQSVKILVRKSFTKAAAA